MAGHGGGAWKVAYADFVTAMMAFFMVMWITAQNKQMKMAVAHYFNDPFNSMSKTKGPNPAGSVTTGPNAPGSAYFLPTKQAGDPPGVVRTKTAPQTPGHRVVDPGTKPSTGGGVKGGGQNKPTLFVFHNGGQQTIGTIILFAGDSRELSDRGREQLKMLVPVLLGKRQKIEIRGHARPRPASDGPAGGDVWQLSYARCVSTMKYLEQAGVEPDRFRLSQAGAYEPHGVKDGADRQARNSCVDVYVLNELAEDSAAAHEERVDISKNP